MFGDAESDHGEDEEALDEAQWRKDRMEREKFLEESVSDDFTLDELMPFNSLMNCVNNLF